MSDGARILRVLVVEDERIISLALANMLRGMGHTVCACVAKGEDALEAARTLAPDLVLLDINLEGEMGGIAVAQELKRVGGPPVAFTSAYTDPATRGKLLALAPLALLAKPIMPQDLHSLVERLNQG